MTFHRLRRFLGLGRADEGLHRCRDCGRSFVCPMDWEADGEEHWMIRLRCGECGVVRELRVTNAQASEFDLELYGQTVVIRRALDRIDREQMESELDVFVAALQRDLIDAADFAR
jgi:hypothetical protein